MKYGFTDKHGIKIKVGDKVLVNGQEARVFHTDAFSIGRGNVRIEIGDKTSHVPYTSVEKV